MYTDYKTFLKKYHKLDLIIIRFSSKKFNNTATNNNREKNNYN